MMISPTPGDGERILIYGQPGTGKSTAAMSLVRDGQTVVVVDTENTYARMCAGEDYPNLTVYNTKRLSMLDESHEWQVVLDSVREAVVNAGENDWLVIDSFTPLWDECQSYYVEQVFGHGIENYFLQRRKEMEEASKKGNALDGNHDWTIINKLFAQLYNLLLNHPGHVLITAEAAMVDDRDNQQIQKEFGAFGYKPKGQKRMAYIPKTVLMTSKRSTGKRYLDTVKERERDELKGAEVELDAGGVLGVYLQDVAGWDSIARIKARMKAKAGTDE